MMIQCWEDDLTESCRLQFIKSFCHSNSLILSVFLGLEFSNNALQLSLCFTLGEVAHLIVLRSNFYQPAKKVEVAFKVIRFIAFIETFFKTKKTEALGWSNSGYGRYSFYLHYFLLTTEVVSHLVFLNMPIFGVTDQFFNKKFECFFHNYLHCLNHVL